MLSVAIALTFTAHPSLANLYCEEKEVTNDSNQHINARVCQYPFANKEGKKCTYIETIDLNNQDKKPSIKRSVTIEDFAGNRDIQKVHEYLVEGVDLQHPPMHDINYLGRVKKVNGDLYDLFEKESPSYAIHNLSKEMRKTEDGLRECEKRDEASICSFGNEWQPSKDMTDKKEELIKKIKEQQSTQKSAMDAARKRLANMNKGRNAGGSGPMRILPIHPTNPPNNGNPPSGGDDDLNTQPVSMIPNPSLGNQIGLFNNSSDSMQPMPNSSGNEMQSTGSEMQMTPTENQNPTAQMPMMAIQ